MSKANQASQQPSVGPSGVRPESVASEASKQLGRQLAGVLYTVRYKSVRGVDEKLITASTPELAQKVAKAWVNSQPGRILLQVNPTVVADETILETHAVEAVRPLTDELATR